MKCCLALCMNAWSAAGPHGRERRSQEYIKLSRRKQAAQFLSRGFKYPIFEFSGSTKPYSEWVLEPDLKYCVLRPSGLVLCLTTTKRDAQPLWSRYFASYLLALMGSPTSRPFLGHYVINSAYLRQIAGIVVVWSALLGEPIIPHDRVCED